MASRGFARMSSIKASPSRSRVRSTRLSILRLGTPALLDIGCPSVRYRHAASGNPWSARQAAFTLRRMQDYRKGGIALIASAAGGILIMSLHPTGRDLLAPGQFAPMALLGGVVHALAIGL